MPTKVTRLEDLLVEEVSIVDRPANKRKFLVVKSEDSNPGTPIVIGEDGTLRVESSREDPTTEGTETDIDKAASDLPDSAFLYVKEGGKKDESGKTAPRNLRMFQVKGPEGLDIPKIKSALARIPKSTLPDDVKTRLTAMAQRMLAAAEKGSKKTEKAITIDPEIRREIFQVIGDAQGRLSSVCSLADVARTDYDGRLGPSTILPVMAEEVTEVIASLTALSKRLAAIQKEAGIEPESTTEPDLETFVSNVVDLVEKRGAKMSAARLGKFKEALGELAKILAELDSSERQDKNKTTTQKAEPQPSPFDALVKRFDAVVTRVETQLQKSAKPPAPPVIQRSNVLSVEGETPRQVERTRWPIDMNREDAES